MQKRAPDWLAAGAALVVIATRWPFRSHALYSWDSANFALAMADIDIAAHRPHPPGYIGYVLAARALVLVFRDANLSLVGRNIIATAFAPQLVGIVVPQVDRIRLALRANPDVDEFDEHREAHREVNVALRNVLSESIGHQ